MRVTSESAEWICLATNLGLEMLSAACDQASSPRRPHFALFGMLLAIAAVLISIGELIYKGKKERVVLRRWGMLWWFYHPPPRRHKPFGTLPDTYGLVAGISQCIFSIVQYVYCLRHADNPFKASLLPAIFLICLGGSRLSNKRMNANTTDNMDSWENSSSLLVCSTEETSLHPISEYYAPANIPFLNNHEVEGNIEHEQRELVQGMVQERELVRERLKREQVQEMMQEKEREQERERLVWERLVRERERERLVRGREQELWERERDRELWERKREREREQEQEQERLELEQEQWQKQLQQTQLWQEQKQKQQEQLPKRQKQQKLRQRRVVKAD